MTLALTMLTVASTIGFLRVFGGHSWIGPAVMSALGVHASCWLTRRWRWPQILALLASLAVLWLIVTWTIFGPTTHSGIPTGRSWDHMTAALRQARQDFPDAIAPVTATTGFRLVTALGVGLVALLADWIALRWKSVLVGAAPAVALFVVSASVGQGPGRQLTIVLETLALALFMLVHRIWASGLDRVWFAGDRSGVWWWALRSGALTGALVMVAVLAVIPLLSAQDGVGVFGWRSGSGPGGGGGPRIVSNPVVDLEARLLELGQTQVFSVKSTVPSYWRLTSLDTFTGDTWISTGSYRGFGARLPGSGAVPPGTRTVVERFQIQELDSVWLPDAFNPVSVTGVRDVSYDSTSNSLITSKKTSNGLTYTVTSYQYLSTLTPSDLETAPAVRDSSFRRYLQLPDSVSPRVVALAQQLTAGKATEYDKALALEDYFLSSTSGFAYSLNPVSNGSGAAALDNFLFNTRSGYCQQFAGAYAVLARAAGLPTRLAVGFATGTPQPGQSYQVYDSDAHTWPEVYFGPKFGWLPFEPTPSFSVPGTTSYAGTGSAGGGHTTAPPELPSGAHGNPQTVAPKTGPRSAPTTTVPAGGGVGGRAHRSGSGFAPLLLLIPAVVVWIALNVGTRRLRWGVRRRLASRNSHEGRVLSYWEDVSELLAWWGITRQPSETDNEYAMRAANRIGRRLGQPSPWLAGGVARLAGLAREAAFASASPPDRPAEAELVATEIHQRLFRAATARQLLAWAFLPRPGGRRRLA